MKDDYIEFLSWTEFKNKIMFGGVLKHIKLFGLCDVKSCTYIHIYIYIYIWLVGLLDFMAYQLLQII